MAEKAVWDDENVRHFIDICKEEISNGNLPLGFFLFGWRIGWKNLGEKWSKIWEEAHKDSIKEQVGQCEKNIYTWFMELKIAATGLENSA